VSPPAPTRLDAHVAVAVDAAAPAALFSSECLAQVHAVARRFPGAISEFFGFECRLADPAANADFLFCSKAEEGGREVLAGLRPDAELSPEILAHPVWQRLRRFARDWARPDSALHEAVRNLWFEFDLAGPAREPPLPSVFFGTESLQAGSAAGLPGWLAQAIAGLRGDPPGALLDESLSRCLAALPAGASIFQVGMMLARPGDAVRICLRGVPAGGRLELLRRIGWPGAVDELAAVLADLPGLADSVDLDLDLLPEVGSKLGLECSFFAGHPAHWRFPAFVDALVERGLCLEDKRAGLLAWPGGVHERSHPERWPADLRRRSAELGSGTASAFIRWPYHVKLVHQAGRPLEAKAYLAVRQFWPTPELVRRVSAMTHTEEVG
jgi:hypothetical protein